MSLTQNNYAIYLPAVNDSYAAEVCKLLLTSRPFPIDLKLKDLIFWEPNSLWYYPYLLHSIGLYSVRTLPDNAVTQRDRTNNTLLGDSGGFQIGCGTMKGLQLLKSKSMQAQDAVNAWKQEYEARGWIVGWLETYTDYAMTIDMPLWARLKRNENTPFHNCSPAQLIEMTVNNLKFIQGRTLGKTKWLNVVQGGLDATQTKSWWDAVKFFRKGGWAMAGSAGAKGGLYNMLSALLMMRDDNAFDEGQDWVHVLGISTPKWAVLLSAIQQSLNHINPKLRVSYDSSSPFQTGGRYEKVVLTPAYNANENTWSFGYKLAPQSRLHADPNSTTPFEHDQSPIGRRLLLNHLSVKGGMWNNRQFDSISNTLLVNHNIWVYLDAFKTANDLAFARDTNCVPKHYIDCLDFIADIFKRGTWIQDLKSNKALLDAVAVSS